MLLQLIATRGTFSLFVTLLMIYNSRRNDNTNEIFVSVIVPSTVVNHEQYVIQATPHIQFQYHRVPKVFWKGLLIRLPKIISFVLLLMLL